MNNKYLPIKDFDIILFLLNNNQNNIVDDDGNNIIHLTIKKGTPCTLFNLLLQLKKEKKIEELLNQRNDDGDTPLHLCFKNKKNTQEFIEILLYFKANPNIPDLNGNIVKFVHNQNGGSISIKGKRFL
jgi:hypothetical protein